MTGRWLLCAERRTKHHLNTTLPCSIKSLSEKYTKSCIFNTLEFQSATFSCNILQKVISRKLQRAIIIFHAGAKRSFLFLCTLVVYGTGTRLIYTYMWPLVPMRSFPAAGGALKSSIADGPRFRSLGISDIGLGVLRHRIPLTTVQIPFSVHAQVPFLNLVSFVEERTIRHVTGYDSSLNLLLDSVITRHQFLRRAQAGFSRHFR